MYSIKNTLLVHSRIHGVAIVMLVVLTHLFLLFWLYLTWPKPLKKNLDKLQFELVELPNFIVKKNKDKAKGGGMPGTSGGVKHNKHQTHVPHKLTIKTSVSKVKATTKNRQSKLKDTTTITSTSNVPVVIKLVPEVTNVNEPIIAISLAEVDFTIPTPLKKTIDPTQTTIQEKITDPIDRVIQEKKAVERIVESANIKRVVSPESIVHRPPTKLEMPGSDKIQKIEPPVFIVVDHTQSPNGNDDHNVNTPVLSHNIMHTDSNTIHKEVLSGGLMGDSLNSSGAHAESAAFHRGNNLGVGDGIYTGFGGSNTEEGFQEGRYRLVGEKIYPVAAKNNQQIGVVRVAVTVSATGEIEQVNLLQPSEYPLLNGAALETARKRYKYIPNRQDGIPQRSEFAFAIEYTLKDLPH